MSQRAWVRVIAVTAACALLSACTFGTPPPDQNGAPPRLPTPTTSPSGGDRGSSGDPSATVEVIATDLAAPWGLAFLKDGAALVTERRLGRIVKVGPPQTANGLTVTAMATVRGVDASGDGGLLGIAASPRFDTDQTVYIYYTTRKDNRIASLKLDGTSAPRVLIDGLPRAATGNGGALAFGPDGDLYAAVGDAAGKPSPAKPKHAGLAGKILRMTTKGKPVKGAKSLVYASGFHDVQGLAWDIGSHMFTVDESGTGAKAVDKLLSVSRGSGSGGSGSGSGSVKTLQTWDPDEATCAGVAVVGNLLATACLTGARVWVVSLTPVGGTLGAPVATLEGVYGRLRAIGVAGDGSLWVMTSNTDGHGHPRPHDDQIVRVVLANAGAGMS